MANMVPHGIDLLGFLRSPLMATPAVKPVTAGKKIPKRTANPGLEISSNPFSIPSDEPVKMDIKESAISDKITY